MKIGLYKNGKLVDYGVVGKIGLYRQLGYEVRKLKEQKATYKHALNHFVRLWNSLSNKQKQQLNYIINTKMSIYERVKMLEVAVAFLYPTITKPKKVSLFRRVLNIIKEVMPVN